MIETERGNFTVEISSSDEKLARILNKISGLPYAHPARHEAEAQIFAHLAAHALKEATNLRHLRGEHDNPKRKRRRGDSK